jgi:hypothetical protein
MIITNNFIIDSLLHIIILLIINLYIIKVSSIREIRDVIIISVIFGLLITYVSHIFFPKLKLSRALKNLEK